MFGAGGAFPADRPASQVPGPGRPRRIHRRPAGRPGCRSSQAMERAWAPGHLSSGSALGRCRLVVGPVDVPDGVARPRAPAKRLGPAHADEQASQNVQTAEVRPCSRPVHRPAPKRQGGRRRPAGSGRPSRPRHAHRKLQRPSIRLRLRSCTPTRCRSHSPGVRPRSRWAGVAFSIADRTRARRRVGHPVLGLARRTAALHPGVRCPGSAPAAWRPSRAGVRIAGRRPAHAAHQDVQFAPAARRHRVRKTRPWPKNDNDGRPRPAVRRLIAVIAVSPRAADVQHVVPRRPPGTPREGATAWPPIAVALAGRPRRSRHAVSRQGLAAGRPWSSGRRRYAVIGPMGSTSSQRSTCAARGLGLVHP